MNKPSWLVTSENIVLNYDGQTHTIRRTDAHASKLLDAIKAQDWAAIPNLISSAKRISEFSNGNIEVRDGSVFIQNVKVPDVLGRKIQEFVREGLPHEPLVKFARNLQLNPSHRALNELYSFLEKNNHPLTENGCFIAYKKVRADFKDIHTGTFDNSVGQVLKMPRNEVNEDPTQTCASGLHCASMHYMDHFGSNQSETDIVIEVEVNPRDVVAIPVDYENSKMRVCEYRVVGLVNQELSTPLRYVNDNLPSSDSEDQDEEVLEECDDDCEVTVDYQDYESDEDDPDCQDSDCCTCYPEEKDE
jgi:hypothetical protein